MDNKYGFGKTVNTSFEQALENVRAELSKEGFGILTEIDAAETVKKKLDKDMPPYRILGACNPSFAHRALEAETSIGLLLPCNVVVRQDDHKQVYVEFMDPIVIVTMVDNPEVHKVAAEVKERLQRVMAAL